MSEIVVRAVEIDPNKKYIIILDERIGPLEFNWLQDSLEKIGVTGLVINRSATIIASDKVGRIETSSDER
jgi:hypothetical protein